MHDVIVIGAGLSGLVCATRLVEANANVIVLEARDRIGGRLLSGRVGGALVDFGGQWITPGQSRVVALAAELDIAIEKHDRSGRTLVEDRGGLRAAWTQWRTLRGIERLMREVAQPSAEALGRDANTLADLLTAITHPVVRARIALHADLVFAAEPASLSLLYYLTAMNATGGFRPDSREGRDEYRLVGGAQQLADKLAAQLGDRVQLGEAVREITQRVAGVMVRASVAHEAKRVVLTIPPPLVRRISVALPAPARKYVEAAFAGPVVKCFAAYERAFWRDRGFSGESYQTRGAVRATVEIAGVPPALLAFVVGAEAARWSTRAPDERRAEVLAAFARFGNAEPLDYVEVDWSADPWSGGCVPGLPPGALSGGARWHEPHDRLHVAGTASATRWPGYMEGAIEAGERAAMEVLAAL